MLGRETRDCCGEERECEVIYKSVNKLCSELLACCTRVRIKENFVKSFQKVVIPWSGKITLDNLSARTAAAEFGRATSGCETDS